MEEILRLEREIERLQKKKEDGVSMLCESSRQELCLARGAEVLRQKKAASRVATEFLELLDTGGPEVIPGEAKQPDPRPAAATEEEVDEGFHAEEECIPLPEFPPPVEGPVDPRDLRHSATSSSCLCRGHSVCTQRSTWGSSTTSSSSTSPWRSQKEVEKPEEAKTVVDGNKEGEDVDRTSRLTAAESMPDTEEPIYSVPGDGESDYDQDDLEDGQSKHRSDRHRTRTQVHLHQCKPGVLQPQLRFSELHRECASKWTCKIYFPQCLFGFDIAVAPLKEQFTVLFLQFNLCWVNIQETCHV